MARVTSLFQRLDEKLATQTKEFHQLNDTVSKIHKDVIDLTEFKEDILQRVEAHDSRLEKIESSCDSTKVSVQKLKGDFDDMAQKASRSQGASAPAQQHQHQKQQHYLLQMEAAQLRDEVVVMGIPEGTDEPLIDVVLAFFTLIGAVIKGARSSIIACHRLGRRDKDKRRAVRVKFSTASTVDTILQAKRTKGVIQASSVNEAWTTGIINVNRRVPQALIRLRSEILRFVSAISPKSVWYQEASVHVRYKEKLWRISNKADLAKLREAARVPSGSEAGTLPDASHVTVRKTMGDKSRTRAAKASAAAGGPVGEQPAGNATK